GFDHAGAGGRAGDPVPRRAVLGARLRDDAVHARAAATAVHGNRHDHRAGLARSRGSGLSRRSGAAALPPSGADRRFHAGALGAAAHRCDALRARLRAHQGALPRSVPARGEAGMKASRLQAFLPVIGVVGLIAVWSLVTWRQWVDPVLLPSPALAFKAFWQGMNGGVLGFDFVKTIYRTAASTAIAAVVAVPPRPFLVSCVKR